MMIKSHVLIRMMLFVVNNKLKLTHQSVSLYLVIAVIYGLGKFNNKIEPFGHVLANRFDLIFIHVWAACHFLLSLRMLVLVNFVVVVIVNISCLPFRKILRYASYLMVF